MSPASRTPQLALTRPTIALIKATSGHRYGLTYMVLDTECIAAQT
jgi:hypothetical protein